MVRLENAGKLPIALIHGWSIQAVPIPNGQQVPAEGVCNEKELLREWCIDPHAYTAQTLPHFEALAV